MLTAGSVYVIGYLKRWRSTPRAMVISYAALATMCAVETFGLLTDESRFVAMGLEYLTYAALIAVLYKTSLRDHFTFSKVS